jgi:hypothetical protein
VPVFALIMAGIIAITAYAGRDVPESMFGRSIMMLAIAVLKMRK